MRKDHQDAFGHGMYDYLTGKAELEVVERDDGYIRVSGGPEAYFTTYEQWPPALRQAVDHARGRVLDIGCGAGRHALHLQCQGLDVVGIDSSPLAIQVCRDRGLADARVMSLTGVTPALGVLVTVLMLGNNFGLVESFRRARWLLRRLRKVTRPGGHHHRFDARPVQGGRSRAQEISRVQPVPAQAARTGKVQGQIQDLHHALV